MTDLAEALASAPLRILARVPDASNAVLLCEVDGPVGPIRCVYKPAAGERPLWDFPGATLGMREVLTARAAACFGWHLVPTTAWRDEGPLGAGMCQEWVSTAGTPPVGLFPARSVPDGWIVVAEGRTDAGEGVHLAHASSADLQRVALLDAIVNNADRKGGHLLPRDPAAPAAIDHGVTWHADPKLRTVLWGWAGEPFPEWLGDELELGAPALTDLVRGAGPRGEGALTEEEVAAALGRVGELRSLGMFPSPGEGWPALPWPPI